MESFSPNFTMTESATTAIAKYPKEASIFAATCAVVFAVLGVIGNMLTIFALLKSQKLRGQATTLFVISNSVSDTMFCVFNLPLTASRFIFEAWIFGDTLCKVFPFIFYGNFGVSVLHIMLIAINRCMLISNYQVYKRSFKLGYAVAMSIAAWLFSFFILLAPLLGIWGTMGLEVSTYSCTILNKDGSSPKKMIFFLGIVFPLFIVLFCYIRIYCVVQRSKRVLRRIQISTMAPCVTSQGKKDDYKLTITMSFIFGGFIICFLPLMIVNVIDDHKISWPKVHIAASVLAWASAVINPVIYSVTSESYRQAYCELLGCNKPASTRMTSGGTRTTTSDAAFLQQS